jgi:hypothetical protein
MGKFCGEKAFWILEARLSPLEVTGFVFRDGALLEVVGWGRKGGKPKRRLLRGVKKWPLATTSFRVLQNHSK